MAPASSASHLDRRSRGASSSPPLGLTDAGRRRPTEADAKRGKKRPRLGRLETANQRTIPASRIWAGGRRRRWQWEARVTRMTRTRSDRGPCWLRPVIGGRSDPARVTQILRRERGGHRITRSNPTPNEPGQSPAVKRARPDFVVGGLGTAPASLRAQTLAAAAEQDPGHGAGEKALPSMVRVCLEWRVVKVQVTQDRAARTSCLTARTCRRPREHDDLGSLPSLSDQTFSKCHQNLKCAGNQIVFCSDCMPVD